MAEAPRNEMYCDRCRARLSPTLPQSVSVGLVSAMQCTQPAMRRTTANGGANSLKQHSLESLKTTHPFSSLKISNELMRARLMVSDV